MKGYLVLEDGTVMEGKAFGSRATVAAELCFRTEMAGYENICNDPAHIGQIIVMTYPLQGNYGLNHEDRARSAMGPLGVIVKDFSEIPSHYQSERALEAFFEDKNIFGLSYVDTRMLTRRIASQSGLRCCLTTEEPHVGLIDEHFKPVPIAVGGVGEVTRIHGQGRRVAVLDLGSNYSLLKALKHEGADIILFPHDTEADDILAEKPDCLIITHGGGDPRKLPRAVETAKALYGTVDTFGIGMGALILALALGLAVEPLPGNGHRGANYPVICADSGKVTITEQNIAFGVVAGGDIPRDIKITYSGINDGGIQGFNAFPRENAARCEGVLFLPQPGLINEWLRGCNNVSGGLQNA